MGGNGNKIVAAVAAALVVVMVLLFVGAGSCSGGGGVSTTPSPAPSSISGMSVASYENEDYETMRDELMQQLTEGTALVGSNARQPQEDVEKISTVSEVSDALKERGIGNDAAITASFTMNGDYIGATELEDSSADKYPSYRIQYDSGSGVTWLVVVNDGSFFATPIASTEGSLSKEVILSETGVVTQFDGTRNIYSDFTFEELLSHGAVGVTVDRIDAAALDSYDFARLQRM